MNALGSRRTHTHSLGGTETRGTESLHTRTHAHTHTCTHVHMHTRAHTKIPVLTQADKHTGTCTHIQTRYNTLEDTREEAMFIFLVHKHHQIYFSLVTSDKHLTSTDIKKQNNKKTTVTVHSGVRFTTTVDESVAEHPCFLMHTFTQTPNTTMELQPAKCVRSS